jgi:spore coat protein U domain-containing protein, fimbrial subunit CupE1/2/3/6
MRSAALAIACWLNIVLASPAGAGSTTAQFDVTITIQAGCEVTGPSDLDFGTHSFIDSAITATTTFSIRCSNGTTGTIALNGGSGTSQSISTRTMETGANSINYNLYTAADYLTIWGDGTTGSTVTHNGTGSAATLTIYGRVPSQTAPTPGAYSDTVTMTVTF